MPFWTTRWPGLGAAERGQCGGGACQMGAVAIVSSKVSGPWAPCVGMVLSLGRGGGGGKGDLVRLAARRAACLALRPTLVPSLGWRSPTGGWRVRWNAAWSVACAVLLASACSLLLRWYALHSLCARRAPTPALPTHLPPIPSRAPWVLIPTRAPCVMLCRTDLELHRQVPIPQDMASQVTATHFGGALSRLSRSRAVGGGRV